MPILKALFLSLILLGGGTVLHAAETPSVTSPTAQKAAPTRPVLSEAGRKRLQENLQILQENIHELKENLSVTQKNLKTIEAELNDLDALEKDHLELRKKFESYLISAQAELKKNDEATAALDLAERSLGSTPDPKSDEGKKLAALRAERQDRLNWKDDATGKTTRAEKLLFDLLKNLRDIQSRRQPLKDELKSWSTREKDYQRMLREAEARKTELEKLAAQ